MGRSRFQPVFGTPGHHRLRWLLALILGLIFVADLALPHVTPLLSSYLLVVVLAASFATPCQMLPLVVAAYALAIGASLYLGTLLTFDFQIRLAAFTGVVAAALHLSADRSRVLEENRRLQKELERRATTDGLTQLLNREEIFQELGKLYSFNHRQGQKLAVLFCDLDRFKEVNDTYGHQAGDAVLLAMAERVRSCLRSSDLAARIGGDELLVALTGVHGLSDAMAIAEKLRHLAQQPVLLPEGEVQISVSVGVALAEAGESIDELIARADEAMYEAKKQGRNQVVAIPPRERPKEL